MLGCHVTQCETVCGRSRELNTLLHGLVGEGVESCSLPTF